MNAILTFSDVSFRYRHSNPVFEKFSWCIPKGKTVLLGPNGAGKTTLLALAADALRPAQGRVELQLENQLQGMSNGERRRIIGWMPQQILPVVGLTVREQVAYAAWLKGLSQKQAWSEAPKALAQVGLSEFANRSCSHLSGGELRRVGLAQALVHVPDIILLDEPTAGLDPAQRRRFRDILIQLSGKRSIIVSTHQVDDLDVLFDNVVVINKGKICFEGTVAKFLDIVPDGPIGRRAEAAYMHYI